MAKKKNAAAAALGKRGGKKRWAGMTKKERSAAMSAIAQKPRPGRKKDGDESRRPPSK